MTSSNQMLFELLALGDVFDHPDQMQRLAMSVTAQAHHHTAPHHTIIPAQKSYFVSAVIHLVVQQTAQLLSAQ